MNAAWTPLQVGRLLAAVGLLAVFTLAGCDNTGSYPTDMVYPLRTDPIVKSVSEKAKKDYAYPPGQLEKAILDIAKEGGELIEPKKVENTKGNKLRRGLQESLEGLFGTPAQPRVQIDQSLPNYRQLGAQLDRLKLDRRSLEEGSKLYRRNCLHCHGVTGDGRGPTGPWVQPSSARLSAG